MKERRPESPETHSSLAEALIKAAQNNPGLPPNLTHQILARAESFPTVTSSTGGLNVLAAAEDTEGITLSNSDAEEQPEFAEEDIDTHPFLSIVDKKPVVRPDEGEISQRQTKNPSKSARVQAKVALRQITGSFVQRSSGATHPEPTEQIEPQALPIISPKEQSKNSVQSPEDQLKEERRRIAMEQRAANKAKKAAEKEAKKLAKSPQPEQSQEIDEALEELKKKYEEIGDKFFHCALLPKKAAKKGMNIRQVWEEWDALNKGVARYTQKQRVELIERLAKGMRIAQHEVDPEYIRAVLAQGVDPRTMNPRNYLFFGVAKLTYESSDQWEPIRAYTEARGLRDGTGWSATYQTFADWLVIHPQHTASKKPSLLKPHDHQRVGLGI